MTDVLPPTIFYIGDLPEVIEDSLVSTTVSISAVHLQTILRTLVVAVQQQGKSVESSHQALGKQQVQLAARIETLHREVQSLKTADHAPNKHLEEAVAQLRQEAQNSASSLLQRVEALDRRLNEELDQLVTDMNTTIDATNKGITEELEKLNRAYLKTQSSAAQQKAQAEQELRTVVEELRNRPAATTVLTVVEEREAAPSPASPSLPPASLLSTAPAATAQLHSAATASASGSTSTRSATAGVAVRTPPVAAEAATTRMEFEKLTLMVNRLLIEVESHATQLRHQRTQAQSLSRKVDLGYLKEQLARKVDLHDHTVLSKQVEAAEQSARDVQGQLDQWRGELTDSHSTLFAEAFEERMGNIYGELFRLDRNKCDRIELEEWFSKLVNHTDAPTLFRFRCLSCNRDAGPFVDPVPGKKSLAEFPPNSMFVSSLQYKQQTQEPTEASTTATTSGSASTGKPKDRKKRPVLPVGNAKPVRTVVPTAAALPADPDPQGVARRRLQNFQEWLRTRQAEESLRRLGEKISEFPLINPPSPGQEGPDFTSGASRRSDSPPAACFGRDGKFYPGVSPGVPPSLAPIPEGPVITPPPPPTPPPLQEQAVVVPDPVSRLTTLRDSLRTS